MSTSPFYHSAAARTERSGDARIDGILGAWAWASPVLAYADPDSPDDYGLRYRSDVDGDGTSAEAQRFAPLTLAQRTTMQAALDAEAPGLPAGAAGFAADGFARLDLAYAGTGSGAAEIRVANSGDADGAYAYLPDGAAEGGDVWLGRAGGDPAPGNYDHLTMLHELGHALGLKHGHADVGYGALPADWDTLEFTVMTYRSFVGATIDHFDAFETWGAPQSFMMLDIAALQHLYGADYTVRSGDTHYAWEPGAGRTWIDGEVALDAPANRVFLTIWDGGGTDTYDLSRYACDLAVDLRPGQTVRLSHEQRADLGGGPDGGLARGNVYNALTHGNDARSLIENAIGGGGHDRMTGNAASNLLSGGAGADKLRGLDGDDTLHGGSGHDRLSGGAGADVLVGGTGGDRLTGGRGADALHGDGGHDRLVGGAGADLLSGGPGRDLLKGGWGADVFRFERLGDSSGRKADRLLDQGSAPAFEGAGRAWGDRIDLCAIDADPTRPGDQAFVLEDRGASGSVWLNERAGDTVVRARVDGEPGFRLVIHDGAVSAAAYDATDFIL